MINYKNVTDNDEVKGLLIQRSKIEEQIMNLDDKALINYELEYLAEPQANEEQQPEQTHCHIADIMPRISHFVDENGNNVDRNAAGVNVRLLNDGSVEYWLGMGFAGQSKSLTPLYEA